MSIILKENETMQDVVEKLGFASEWVYEIAPIAYWYEELYPNGRIREIHFSRRMREMLGYKSTEEFPDALNTLMTFTHPDDVHLMLDDAILAGTGQIDKYDVQYRIRRADGSYAWCNATGQQVRSHEGVIIGMYGAFIDISAEIALREEQESRERERLQQALETAREEALRSEMLYTVGKTEKWAYQITAADEVLTAGVPDKMLEKLDNGCAADALAWMRFIHPEDRDKVEAEFMAAVRDRSGQTPYNTAFRLLGKDGQYLWIRSVGRIMPLADGARHFIGLSMDTTEQAAEQRKRELAQQTLNEALQDDGVFLIDCKRDTRRTVHDRLSGAANYDDTENYSAAFSRYVEKYVCAPDRETMRRFTVPADIPALLGDKKELKIRYRDKTTGIQRFYEMRIVRFSETEILQSFKEIDAQTVNSLLFEKLRENYVALFGVDLESGLIRSYKEDPLNIVGGEGSVTELSAAMKALAAYFEGETRDFFEKIGDTAYLKEKFAKEDKAEYIYRSVNDDANRWLSVTGIVLQRSANGEPLLLCMGFSYLDDDAAELQTMQEELNTEVQRSELFFDTFNAGKWVYKVSADDEILSAEYSDAVYRSTNAAATGRPMGWIERVHPEDRARILAQFMAAVKDHTQKTRYDVDFRVIGRDGKIRWTKSAGKMLRRDDGTGEFFGMNIDITDEVEEQERFQAQKAETDQFISSFIKDYGTVFKVNRIDDTFQILKKTDQLCIGMSFEHFSQVMEHLISEIVYGPDRDMVRRRSRRETVSRELKENRTYSIEYRVLMNGNTRWDRMTFSVLDETYVAVGFAVGNREIILNHLQEREYENYYALFSIDLDTAQITMLKNDSGYATGTVDSVVPYSEAMKAFANTLEGDAREFFLGMSDIDRLKRIHFAETKTTYVYRSALDEQNQWVRATYYVVMRHDDGSPAVITLGFNFMDSMGADRQEKLARMTAVSNYFIKSYSSACYCDMRTGSVVILQSNPALTKRIEGKKITYSSLLYEYVNDLVHPEDRETMRRCLDTAYIRRRLRNDDDFSFTFRVTSNHTPGVYRCTVIRGADEDHIGIGFRNVTEEMKKERELERADDLIKTFASEYEAVFVANLSDGSYRTVSKSRMISAIFNGEGTFSDALDRYTAQIIHPLDRERAGRERIPLDRTGEGIAVGASHSVEYRGKTEDGYAWYRGTMNRISRDMILVGFKNIDEEKLYSIIEDTIIGEFDALYMVDLDRDEIRSVRASRISKVGNFSGKLVYSRLCRKFSETVAPKYRQDWIRFSDIRYMKRYMGKSDRREYIYELSEAGVFMRRLTASVIERVNGEASLLLLSFTGIDDQRAQSILLERKMAEQNAFTQYFLEPYESAYYVGLNDLSWQSHKRTDQDDKRSTVREDYVAAFTKFVQEEVVPEDREQFAQLTEPDTLRERLALSSSFSFTFRLLPEEPTQIYRCEVIRGADEDHAAFGFRNITDEIEEQEKQARKLREALENAQAASKAKTDFLFNMSHDIRTPMNAIIGFTNMAMKHIDDRARVLDSLTKTQEAGELLLSLINDILDMSRIESGKIKLDENEGDVFLSFINIESTMQELAGTKEQELTFTVDNIRDRYVYADFSRCIRVFVNIITNAIKYTDRGGFIRVRCEQIGARDGYGYYRYTFTDNGIGMSEEFQKRVFDEFTREETATVSGIQGTGLGLAVCRTFVTAMNGTIECASRQGIGSTFTVVLPFRIQEGTLYTDPLSGRVVSGTESEEKKEQVDFSGKRVLLVEDNELNQEIAEDILSEEGMLVETAADGSLAVEILREKGPDYFDFVLMDIQMPIMNGYEATKAIRSMYPKARLPIIALSANAFEEDKIASLTAGMNDHVAKPIELETLKAALAKYL